MTTGKKRPIIKNIFRIRRWAKRFTHPAGGVRFGHLRRLHPISDNWGFDRGLPVDRYYVESFLEQYRHDLRGRTLEFSNNAYTARFGDDRVTKSDVLDKLPDNPAATLVADISGDNDLPDNAFDCIICTQTLTFIYDLHPAIATLHRILKPEGVLLATLPGISRISAEDMELYGDYWRFTDVAARRLFMKHFADEELLTGAYGNVLSAVALLHGLASQELTRGELDYRDDHYQVLVTVRAVKGRQRES